MFMYTERQTNANRETFSTPEVAVSLMLGQSPLCCCTSTLMFRPFQVYQGNTSYQFRDVPEYFSEFKNVFIFFGMQHF